MTPGLRTWPGLAGAEPGFKRVATVSDFLTAGFSFDDEPTVNSQDELRRAVTSDKWRVTSSTAKILVWGAVRMGECNHET